MVKCSARYCSSATYNKIPGITFHRFPKNDDLKKIWVQNMKRKNWQPNSNSVLCSKHFENHLLDSSVFRTRLRPVAIPTLFQELLKEKAAPANKRSGAGHFVFVSTEQLNNEVKTEQFKTEPQPSSSKQIDENSESPQFHMTTSGNVQLIRIIDPREEVQRLKKIIVVKNKKIRALEQKNRRLKQKVSKFADIISNLKPKHVHDDVQIISNIPVE